MSYIDFHPTLFFLKQLQDKAKVPFNKKYISTYVFSIKEF